MEQHLAIQKDEVKARQKWFGRFRKEIPAKTVVRSLQIENKLDAIIQAKAAQAIPLVRKDGEVPRPVSKC